MIESRKKIRKIISEYSDERIIGEEYQRSKEDSKIVMINMDISIIF